MALGLLIANVIGGVAAVLAYELLRAAPSPWLLAGVVLLAGLLFGRLIASGGPRAPLGAPAFVTMLLLLGQSMTPISEGASQSFSDRLTAVLVGAAIACAGVKLLDVLTTRRSASPPIAMAGPGVAQTAEP